MGATSVLVAGATSQSHLMGADLRQKTIEVQTKTARENGLVTLVNITAPITKLGQDLDAAEDEMIQNAIIARDNGADFFVVAPLLYLNGLDTVSDQARFERFLDWLYAEVPEIPVALG